MDEKLSELEPRVSHSFVIKIVSWKKLSKVLAPPQTHFHWNFSVSKSRCVCMRYHNIFFAILKLYFWSIHMANNLILAISFGFKLNSNLNGIKSVENQSYRELTEDQSSRRGWVTKCSLTPRIPCRDWVPEENDIVSVYTPHTKLTSGHLFQSSSNAAPSSTMRSPPADTRPAEDLVMSVYAPYDLERSWINLLETTSNTSPGSASSIFAWAWKGTLSHFGETGFQHWTQSC